MATSRCRTSALDALRGSLGDRAALLEYLQFDKAHIQSQGEIPLALPNALLFGIATDKGRVERRPRVWTYLCRKSLSLVCHTYYRNGNPGGFLIIDDVLRKAAPHEAFRFATDPMRLLVLATYYFIKVGVETTEELSMTPCHKRVLLSICEDIRQEKERSALSKKPSKVVKLRVCVPLAHFAPTTESEKDTVTQTYRQQHDSGVADMNSDRNELAADSPDPVGKVAVQNQTRELQKVTQSSSVDRYLHLETEEKSLQQKLEACGRRMESKRERMESLKESMDQDLDEVDALFERQNGCEAEKKRMWDTMSKEDFREMGRRDVTSKWRKSE